MTLTDRNIDEKSARYWCFLSDKTLRDALKDVTKDANKHFNAKHLNEEAITLGTIAMTAASVVLWDVLDRAYQNLTDTTKLDKYEDMIDSMKNHAYLDTDTVKTELAKLDKDEFYKLVQASYTIRNYGQETKKNSILDKTVLGYERYRAEDQVTNSDMHKDKTFYATSPIEDQKKNFGTFNGRDQKHDTFTVKSAYEYISKFNPVQIAAATAVDVTIDNSTTLLRTKEETASFTNPFAPVDSTPKKDFRDEIDPLTVQNGMFISGVVDYDKRTIDQLEKALVDGKLQAEVKKGKIQIADNMAELNDPATINAVQQQNPEINLQPNNPEDKVQQKNAEDKVQQKNAEMQQTEIKAAKQSVKDSPDIQKNNNAVVWIAAAAAVAIATPYLWKRLKQLSDYVKSGKTFAKCQFKCKENGQKYVFEYDLKQMKWKLKFAGSTVLKYTPYPSDDEVRSFIQTKFAKKFVDEVERQLKDLYSAKDKKLLFKAVQAAGKKGSEIIKYLFDNQKAIENSLYKIKKHKLWESITRNNHQLQTRLKLQNLGSQQKIKRRRQERRQRRI